MAKISNAAKRRHLETGGQEYCPYCGTDADHLEYEDLSPVENGSIEQRVRCTKCGRCWLDVFTLTAVRELAGERAPETGSAPDAVPPLQIPAEAHSDDRTVEAAFDAAPYFEQAPDEDLLELARCGWRNDYPADEVAQFMAAHDPQVRRLFEYLGFEPVHAGERIGFECSVEVAPAIAWVRMHRTALLARLVEEGLADIDAL